MKSKRFLLALLLLLSINIHTREQVPQTQSSARHHLMPVPMSLSFRPGRLAFNNSFRVAVDGYKDARLQRGVERALKRLGDRTGLELARSLSNDAASSSLLIQTQGPGQAIPSLNEDES